jgi:hypothetical protein
MPQIREDSQAPAAVVDHKRHTIHGIVGSGNRLHGQLADADGGPGFERPNVVDIAQVISCSDGLEGLSGDMDGQAKLPLEDAHAFDVIRVLVRNEHGIHRTDVDSLISQPLLGEVPRDAGIEQQPNAIGFHVDTVAVAAGLQGNDSHRCIVSAPVSNVVLMGCTVASVRSRGGPAEQKSTYNAS